MWMVSSLLPWANGRSWIRAAKPSRGCQWLHAADGQAEVKGWRSWKSKSPAGCGHICQNRHMPSGREGAFNERRGHWAVSEPGMLLRMEGEGGRRWGLGIETLECWVGHPHGSSNYPGQGQGLWRGGLSRCQNEDPPLEDSGGRGPERLMVQVVLTTVAFALPSLGGLETSGLMIQLQPSRCCDVGRCCFSPSSPGVGGSGRLPSWRKSFVPQHARCREGRGQALWS